MDTIKKGRRLSWRSWHRWVGLVLSVMIILFCLSGIVMNHRKAFTSCEVSRCWLPEVYHINDWNQGILRGVLDLEGALIGRPDSICRIMYGQAGLWITDNRYGSCEDFNEGIRKGIDNRKISNLVQTGDGKLWCAGLYDAYCYDKVSKCWETIILPDNKERVSDITVRGADSVVVVTRSRIYVAVAPDYKFRQCNLVRPQKYVPEVTLFKTFWMLHSGELFGLPGRIVVDIMGGVIIVLCLTGIVFFVTRMDMKRLNKIKKEGKEVSAKAVQAHGLCLRWNLKLHSRLGYWTIIPALIISVTGMCLRPPLMIPLAIINVPPVPGSTLDNDNFLHDKLRAIRWDDCLQKWILYTSEGFSLLDGDIDNSCPQAIDGDKSPMVSPMGVNVFCRDGEDWLIGSFSGLFRWNVSKGTVVDYYTGEAYTKPSGRPIGAHSVTGMAPHSDNGDVVFEYNATPNKPMPAMPPVLAEQPMSLWNFALELHVGRCYEPFMGSVFSVLYVFLAGLALTLILVSGLIIHRK